MSSIRRRLNSVVFSSTSSIAVSLSSSHRNAGASPERPSLSTRCPLVDRRAAPRARTRAMRPPTPTLRARARAPMPTKPAGAIGSMSVDDTNALRAKLGLAPLRRPGTARVSRRRERARRAARRRDARPQGEGGGETETPRAPTRSCCCCCSAALLVRSARVVGEESRIDGE